jgi:glycosyltransferase involved in cell wall biosynthesis
MPSRQEVETRGGRRRQLDVLVLGRDATVFAGAAAAASDSRSRHRLYARLLRERCGEASSLRVVSFSPRAAGFRAERLPEGLALYPTRSRARCLFLLDALRLLPRVLRGWRPDVITAQTPWEEGLLGLALARLLGVRFLAQLHFDLFSAEWRRESRLNPLRRRVSAWVLKRADGVRVVSLALASRVHDELGVPRRRVFVAPVGLEFEGIGSVEDREPYKAAISPELVGRPVALFVGRFYRPKNLPLWVEVAARVAAAMPEARFVLAGDGPLLGEVEALVETRGLSGRFHLLGDVARERLPAVYAAADALLVTSDHESFGRVVLEAMRSAVPVVATDCAGPRELIRDGIDGFLRPRGDAEKLGEAVIRVLRDPAAAREMGRRGRERAAREYSSDQLARHVVECWARAAGGVEPGETTVETLEDAPLAL